MLQSSKVIAVEREPQYFLYKVNLLLFPDADAAAFTSFCAAGSMKQHSGFSFASSGLRGPADRAQLFPGWGIPRFPLKDLAKLAEPIQFDDKTIEMDGNIQQESSKVLFKVGFKVLESKA